MSPSEIVAQLSPAHAQHGAADDAGHTESSRTFLCRCGVSLTFTAMDVATALLYGDKAEHDKHRSHHKKEAPHGS